MDNKDMETEGFFGTEAMEEHNAQVAQAQAEFVPESERKTYIPSIVGAAGGIIGFAIIPIIGLILWIVGLVMANKNADKANVKTGKIISIIAIVLSVIGWIIGIIVVMNNGGALAGMSAQ